MNTRIPTLPVHRRPWTRTLRLTGALFCASALQVSAADWPQAGYDAAGSCRSPGDPPASLSPIWTREFPRPRPAWRQDHLVGGPRHQIDKVYQPVVLGKIMVVPSMVNDSLTALDTDTGNILWRFFCDGPVRFAPVAFDGKVCAGSDDGCLYCLSITDGKLLWKFSGAPANRMIIGHDRLISSWPVSGGPVLDNGRIYFASGIWPIQTVFVHALDAKTGIPVWSWDFGDGAGGGRDKVHPTIQGYLRLVDGKLHVPGDLILSADTGEYVGSKAVGKTNVMEWVADGKRFKTTREGVISCSGPGGAPEKRFAWTPGELPPGQDGGNSLAGEILAATHITNGYALALGIGNGRLIEDLVRRSTLRIVVLETDGRKIEDFRRKLDDAGLYGSRVHVLSLDLLSAQLPPCAFSLAISDNAQGPAADPSPAFLERLFPSIRPYGGTACLRLPDASANTLAARVREAGLVNGRVTRSGTWTFLTRSGSLPGAGRWTHPEADAGNTLVSADERVRPPLGPLWFGGESAGLKYYNRAASSHAPLIAGGRMIFQGPDLLFAVDVYTGRVLWQMSLAPENTPYRRRGIPVREYGFRETLWYSAVAMEDRVYVGHGARILCLDPATGARSGEICLPPDSPTSEYIKDIRCSGGTLLAITPQSILAWNRSDCAFLWKRQMNANIRDQMQWNGIPGQVGFFAAGDSNVFAIAGMSPMELEAMGARVTTAGSDVQAVVLALNTRTGKPLWAVPFQKGFLSLQYSTATDVLLQGPGNYGDHNAERNPIGQNITAYRGADGQVLWQAPPELGPYLLHGNRVITQEAHARDIRTGRPLTSLGFKRGYCGQVIGTHRMLMLRQYPKGPAACFDLADNREISLHSFRPGCRNNLTIGDGVMVAPMFQTGCSCSFPIWSSLAFTQVSIAVPPLTDRLNRLAWRLGKDAPASLLSLRDTLAAPANPAAAARKEPLIQYLATAPEVVADIQRLAQRMPASAGLANSELLGHALSVCFSPESTPAAPSVFATVRGSPEGIATGTVTFTTHPAGRLAPTPKTEPVRLAPGETRQIVWAPDLSKPVGTTPFSIQARAALAWQGVPVQLTADVQGCPSVPLWAVIGPFDIKTNRQQEIQTSIETGSFDLQKKFAGPDGYEIGWTRCERPAELKMDSEYVVDLERIFSGRKVAAYAATGIRCPQATEAILALGSGDGVTVWLNGRRIHDQPKPRLYRSMEDRIPIQLEAGINRLLIKISHGRGSWQYCAHITNKNGGCLDSVTYSLDQ